MKRPWIRRSLAGLGVLILLAAALTAFLHLGFGPHGKARHHRATPPAVAATPTPAASPTPAVAAGRLLPGTLVIPKISVQAPIEQVTVDSHNDMAVPQKPTDVGWYAPGVAPGQAGDAVIDGHLDWYGVPKAVFYYLDQLKAGDEVDVISEGGVKLRFQVTDSSLVSASSHPTGLFATTGSPRLTLITCAGDWNPGTGQYGQRLLVDTSFVGPGS